jgi:Domain of unknown function (DUF4292)
VKSLLCVFAALALSGCATVKESTHFVPTESPEEVIRSVNFRKDSVTTFQGSGSISLETPSFVNSVSFEVAIREPDSTKIVFEGPFGIRLASALFTQQHFVFYNSLKNEVTEGDNSQSAMPMMSNVGITPKELLQILTGERRIAAGSAPPDSFYVKDDSYVLQFRKAGQTTQYDIDGKTLTMRSVEVDDSLGNPIITEQYEYDRNEEGDLVPKQIRISYTPSESSLSLSYDSVVLNHDLHNLSLTIPRDAKRHMLDLNNDGR